MDSSRMLPGLLATAAALLRRAGNLPQPVTVSVSTDTAVPAITLRPPAFTKIADFRASIDAIAQVLGVQAALHLESVDSYRASGLFQDAPVLALAVQPQQIPECEPPADARTTSTEQVADLLTELADWIPGIGTDLIQTLVVHDTRDHLTVQVLFATGREAEAAAAIAATLPVQTNERGWDSALMPSGHPLTYNTPR